MRINSGCKGGGLRPIFSNLSLAQQEKKVCVCLGWGGWGWGGEGLSVFTYVVIHLYPFQIWSRIMQNGRVLSETIHSQITKVHIGFLPIPQN